MSLEPEIEYLYSSVEPRYIYTDSTGRKGHVFHIERNTIVKIENEYYLYHDYIEKCTFENDIYSQLRMGYRAITLLGISYDLSEYTENQIKDIFYIKLQMIVDRIIEYFSKHEKPDFDENAIRYSNKKVKLDETIIGVIKTTNFNFSR